MYTGWFAFSIVRDCWFVVVLILDRGAWRVWSGCAMKCFCCITVTAIIYSVQGYDFKLPWHWDELTDCGNCHISYSAISLRLLTYIVLEATNNSAGIQQRSKLNWWKSSLKPRPKGVSQNLGTAKSWLNSSYKMLERSILHGLAGADPAFF